MSEKSDKNIEKKRPVIHNEHLERLYNSRRSAASSMRHKTLWKIIQKHS
jgi:hypothetical protein